MIDTTSLRLRLLAIASLSLLACSDSDPDSGEKADQCEIFHPDVKQGAGGGSQQLPRMTRSCYRLSPEKENKCLPGSSATLLTDDYLQSDPIVSCGSTVLSVRSDATQETTPEGIECCYDVCSTFSCVGRPLVVEREVRLAPLRRASDPGWSWTAELQA